MNWRYGISRNKNIKKKTKHRDNKMIYSPVMHKAFWNILYFTFGLYFFYFCSGFQFNTSHRPNLTLQIEQKSAAVWSVWKPTWTLFISKLICFNGFQMIHSKFHFLNHCWTIRLMNKASRIVNDKPIALKNILFSLIP